jgi:hypothetical protein
MAWNEERATGTTARRVWHGRSSMPKNFYLFDEQADFWTPMNCTHTEMASTQYALGTMTRLKRGVSIQQAQMDALARSKWQPIRYGTRI